MLPVLAATALIALAPTPDDPGSPVYFGGCPHRTGTSATVIIPSTARVVTEQGAVEAGDELAVLAPDGSCAGVAVWSGEGIAVSVWGDDPFTPVLDGLLEGDSIEFAAYDASEGLELGAATVVYEEEFAPAEGYRRDDLYVLGVAAAATDMEEGPSELRLEQSYPNPATDRTMVPFVLSAPGTVSLEVFDTLGRRVLAPLAGDRLSAGAHRVEVDVQDLAPGLYVYRLVVDGEVRQRTLTVSR